MGKGMGKGKGARGTHIRTYNANRVEMDRSLSFQTLPNGLMLP